MKKLYTISRNLRLGVLLLLIGFFPLKSFTGSYFDTGESSISLITESYHIETEEILLKERTKLSDPSGS